MTSAIPPRSANRLVQGAILAAILSTVVSGSFAPAATASAATPGAVLHPVARSTAPTASAGGWFVDPRTPAQRRSELAVPRHPRTYHGKRRETLAVYRTRSGALAVPALTAFGRAAEAGQAFTLDQKKMFGWGSDRLSAAGRSQVRRLGLVLAEASSIRCEGYTDYAGSASRNRQLARARASVVCAAIATQTDRARTRAVGFGPRHPAVVSRHARDRHLNRRVVVQVTAVRSAPVAPPVPPVPHVPPAPVVQPDAPTISYFGYNGVLSYWDVLFSPGADHGVAVTAYEVSVNGGPWVAAAEVVPGSGMSAHFPCSDGDCGWSYGTPIRLRAVTATGASEPSAPYVHDWI